MPAAYERFVRDVFEALMAQDAVTTIAVQHDARVLGRSGATHQIDVFWEFSVAGQRYRTCVECKHYSSSRVKKTHIASFAAIVADIGSANGVFVTSGAYQAGARTFAEHHAIRLLTINYPINHVHLTAHIAIPHISDFEVFFDEDTAREVASKSDAAPGDVKLHVSGADFRMRRRDTGEAASLEKAIAPALSQDGARTVDLSQFECATSLGWLPLRQARFSLSTSMVTQRFSIAARQATQAIVQDVLANRRFYVAEDGSIVDSPMD